MLDWLKRLFGKKVESGAGGHPHTDLVEVVTLRHAVAVVCLECDTIFGGWNHESSLREWQIDWNFDYALVEAKKEALAKARRVLDLRAAILRHTREPISIDALVRETITFAGGVDDARREAKRLWEKGVLRFEGEKLVRVEETEKVEQET